MINPVVSVLRMIGLLIVTLGMIPVQSILVNIGGKSWLRFARGYWRWMIRAAGFRIRVHGTIPESGPTLVVSNHASYLDILVLGSLLLGSFVSKSEVSRWPGIGFVTKLGRTVFIDRSRKGSTQQRNVVRERLEEGGILVLFPEGTSNDGNYVLPFKSTLFSVAETPVTDNDGASKAVMVQPVTIAYSGLDGLPMQRAFRPFFAWYGDMTLMDHLYTALGLGNLTIDVIFHAPTSIENFSNRKTLSLHCQTVIQRGLGLALSGRLSLLGET